MVNTGSVLVVSLLLSVLIPVLAHKAGPLAAVCAGVLFLVLPFFLLKGDIFRRSVYWFFVIQFTASYFLQLSLAAMVISLALFPLVLSRKASSEELNTIPNWKSLLLLLSGGVASLIYLILANSGEIKYYWMYDIFFLLGLGIAYEMFYLLRFKILDLEKLMAYITFSGLALICFVFVRYLIAGNIGLIFNERFGSSVDINPNMTAAYLDLTLPGAFFTAFFEKRNFVKKALFYALSLLYAGVIFMAATRGSLPGIAIIVIYVIWRKRSKKLLLAALISTIIVFLTIGAMVIERTFSPNTSDILSNIGRVEMLRTAFRILADNHYFFGIGMNNFSLAKFDYGFPLWFDGKRVMSSHNLFTEIWLGWGILGLLGWIIFNIGTASSLIRKNKNSGAANAVAFAIIAFSAHGLFDSLCANFSIMLTYFSLVGAGLFIIARTNPKPA
jgi:O-antigen ligase